MCIRDRPEPAPLELLTANRQVTDEVVLSGERLLAVNVRLTDQAGGPPGCVATLRDSTELLALSGRAERAQRRLRLLYDAGVTVGSTLDVTRTAEELAQVTVPRFADFVTVDPRSRSWRVRSLRRAPRWGGCGGRRWRAYGTTRRSTRSARCWTWCPAPRWPGRCTAGSRDWSRT